MAREKRLWARRPSELMLRWQEQQVALQPLPSPSLRMACWGGALCHGMMSQLALFREAMEPSQAGTQLEGVALEGWACKGAA